MRVYQLHYQQGQWSKKNSNPGFDAAKCQLVLIFGASACISGPAFFNEVKSRFPAAAIVLSSTSGEIMDDNVFDDSAVITAVEFDHTGIHPVITNIRQHGNSYETGKYLMQQLQGEDLSTVFILSDGTHINGSELVAGFSESNHKHIPITGGLAGDAARFAKTLVGLNSPPDEGNIVAVGFYGNRLQIGHGSFGGWDEFGHERLITRSSKNVLFELDGRNALDLYKEYLGPYVDELPGSALLFPLSLRINGSGENIVRTILSIDEKEKSMTFAGNLPEGSKVRLMKANFDKLIDGSATAATHSFEPLHQQEPDLAVLISCVGRKLVLQKRIDEEVHAAKDIFGSRTAITGFYSYGEISPLKAGSQCELHNQTMTITTFSES